MTANKNSKKPIQAGLIADVKKTLQKLSDVFFKFIDSFVDYDIDVIKTEQTRDGGQKVKCKDKSTKSEFDVVASAPDKKGYVDVVVKFKDGRPDMELGKLEEKDVDSKEVIQPIVDALQSGDVGVKTSVKVTLQKVTGSKNMSNINLLAIESSCNMNSAMQLLDEVLDDDEFVSELSEEPKSYQLSEIEDSDEIEVSSISSDFTPNNTACQMLYSAILLMNNLRVIHWNATGPDFFVLHEKLDTYLSQIMSDIDVLGEICMELNDTAPNPGNLPDDYITGLIQPDAGFDKMTGFQFVADCIASHIATLESAYVSFSSDIQSELDNMIRFWKTECDYKLKRLIYGVKSCH